MHGQTTENEEIVEPARDLTSESNSTLLSPQELQERELQELARRQEILIQRRCERLVHRLYHITIPLDQRLLLCCRPLCLLETPQKVVKNLGLGLTKEKIQSVVTKIRAEINKILDEDAKRVAEGFSSKFLTPDPVAKKRLLESDSDSSSSSTQPPKLRRPPEFPLRVWNAIEYIEQQQILRIPYASRLSTGLGAFEIIEYPSKSRELDFYVIPGALNIEEVECCKRCHTMPSSTLIADRHKELDYVHKVWRIEDTFINRYYKVFSKIMFLIEAIDARYWKKLRTVDHLYPETEYILYDKKQHIQMKELPYVGPHVDNESVVTMVGMLSDRAEYEGGINHFESGGLGLPDRKHHLNLGDIVIFRGEQLEHWITPVTSGVRQILQIEVSFSRNNRSYSDAEDSTSSET